MVFKVIVWRCLFLFTVNTFEHGKCVRPKPYYVKLMTQISLFSSGAHLGLLLLRVRGLTLGVRRFTVRESRYKGDTVTSGDCGHGNPKRRTAVSPSWCTSPRRGPDRPLTIPHSHNQAPTATRNGQAPLRLRLARRDRGAPTCQ